MVYCITPCIVEAEDTETAMIYRITYLDNDCIVEAEDRVAAIEMAKQTLRERLGAENIHQSGSDFWLDWRVETEETT